MYSFPNFKPAHCPKSSSNCCFFTYIRFLRRQVRWSGIPISWRIFHNLLWSTWSKPLVYSQWSRSRCFSVIPLFFSMIQQMLAIWSLVPLPFLNPASTSGSSQLMHWWNLAWRILNTTLLAWKWVQLCSSLNILWHCLSLGLGRKLTFSNPVATAEFSRFAGILSAALTQHHLLGFEIAQLEFHPFH